MGQTRGEVTVAVLGPTVVRVDGIPVSLTSGEAQLVALLVAAGEAGLDADALATAYWPDEIPATWRTSLRNAISRLNRKVTDRGATGLVPKASRRRHLQVPPEQVDAWRLVAAARAGTGGPFDAELLRGEPFEGCEPGDRLRAAADLLQAARRDLLARYLDDGGEVTGQIIDVATAAGLDDLVSRATPPPPTPDRQSSRRLERLARHPILRPEQEIADLVEHLISHRVPGFLLHGESGVGKTTLAAEVAQRLGQAGYHTAYVAAQDRQTPGWDAPANDYRPFLDGIRSLRTIIDPRGGRYDVEATADLTGQIVTDLETTYAGRPLCLVVDNVQWLDPGARALLTVIANADLDLEVVVLAAGQVDQATAPWRSWLTDLTRCQLEPYEVTRLAATDVGNLLATLHESIPGYTRHRMAEEIYRRSSGVPAVALHFARNIDPVTMQLPAVDSGHTGFPAVVADLDRDIAGIGAAAAVLGLEFTPDQICRLAGYDAGTVRRALAHLVDAGHLEPADPTGWYRFPHVLLADAFARLLDDDQRVALHLKAFDQATDPATRAHHSRQAHLLGQGPTGAEVARLLVAVAVHQAGEGSFWRAAENFREARQFDATALALEERIVELESLERAGQPSRGLRWDLVMEANSADRPDLALAAAVSGLPDVEDIWGDANRVAALRMVDPARLDRADRLLWAVHFSRQLLLIGDSGSAYDIAHDAFRQARTGDEKAQTWMAMNRARGWTAVTDQVEDLPWLAEVTDPDIEQQVRQSLTISRIARGHSRADHPALTENTARTRHRGRRSVHWFALLFEATALADQGLITDAAQLANDARHQGLRHGITIAPDTHLLQNYVWIYHGRQHGGLHAMLEADKASHASGNLFYRAGMSAARFAHHLDDPRRRREAAIEATMVLRQAQDSQFAAEITGLLAPALAVAANQGVIEFALEKLRPMESSYLLVGSAIANLGPVASTVAQLTADDDRRRDLHQEAVDQADSNNLALWQVACRVDLAVELDPGDTRRETLLDEARGCAATDWLVQVLEGRLAWGTRLRGLRSS